METHYPQSPRYNDHSLPSMSPIHGGKYGLNVTIGRHDKVVLVQFKSHQWTC